MAFGSLLTGGKCQTHQQIILHIIYILLKVGFFVKLTLIGAGVRTVFFAKAVAKYAGNLGVEELAVLDVNEKHLSTYGDLAVFEAKKVNPKLTITLTKDATIALKHANIIVTTLRVGEDKGRVLDERIALKHGVIGQETTGPGGFSFALRSIPAMLEYCALAEKISDNPIIFNFTNPSGLVTQAMHSAGYKNVIGICDGPTHMKSEIAQALDVDVNELFLRIYGLNHLSFTNSVKVKGVEILPQILNSNLFLEQLNEFKVFSPDLIRTLEGLPNEYLYYYYYRHSALANIKNSDLTRGETILALNETMLKELNKPEMKADLQIGADAYYNFIKQRESSYMSIETTQSKNAVCNVDFKAEFGLNELQLSQERNFILEGYSGVAFNYIEAVRNNTGIDLPLNVPNKGAIPFLEDDDIIEITCKVDKNGATPEQIPLGSIPLANKLLIQQVKLYEKLTVKAIEKRSKDLAKQALLAHPLVSSYETASNLVDDYLKAFEPYVGTWS